MKSQNNHSGNSNLTFQDGIWCAVEIMYSYEDTMAMNLVRETNFSRKQCLKLSKVSGIGEPVFKALDEMDTWKNEKTVRRSG